MKRCPTCNQTFEEDWLSFCTRDGTTLVDDQGVTREPLPTIESTPPPVATSIDRGAWNLPAAGPVGGAQVPTAQPGQPVWQPPPPPSSLNPQSGSLATTSMIIGIASIFCLGPILAIVAIILGAMALSQIKKNPQGIGGRRQAVTGIVTGSVSIVIHAVIIIFYILIFVFAAANH
jgi:hypothetical protein